METINEPPGVHTFSFFQRMTAGDSYTIGGALDSYARKTPGMKRYPIDKGCPAKGWEYTYDSKGIRWRLLSRKVNDSLTIYGLYVIITPRVLIAKDYISAATEADIERVENLFNEEAARISPLIKSFGSCSLNRCDPCINFDLDKLGIPCASKRMFKLIKRGDMPSRHYSERTEYSNKSRRRKADKDNFYLESKSVTLNCYPKYVEIIKKNPNCPGREKAVNIIRFEMQYKYPKLRALAEGIKHKSKYYRSPEEIPEDEFWEMLSCCNPYPAPSYLTEEKPVFILNPSNPADVLLSDSIFAGAVRKYYNKVIRQGDYFTLDGARWMVKAHNFRRDKEERLIWALELISESRSIAKAKTKLYGEEVNKFKRSLDDLDEILVNPVTIPRDWSIEHIPNLLRAYDNKVSEERADERFMTNGELLFEKLLAEYLS